MTQADLHYVGSVTVDEDLLDAADLLAGEQVHIVDVDQRRPAGDLRDRRRRAAAASSASTAPRPIWCTRATW